MLKADATVSTLVAFIRSQIQQLSGMVHKVQQMQWTSKLVGVLFDSTHFRRARVRLRCPALFR